MRVLVIDNYDSFTHNLVQMIEARGASCSVLRSDAVGVDDALAAQPDRIVLSPGPFGPERTGICRPLVERAGSVPVLGICLGMQVIAAAAGARIVESGRPVHGKVRSIAHDGSGTLAGLDSPQPVGLYHSLVVDPASIDASRLRVFATERESGTVMGVRWSARPVEGLLFHPESFLTPAGPRMLANFLEHGVVV